MNPVRLSVSILLVAIVLYVFDVIYHGLLLGSTYEATAESWRTEDEMLKRIPFQILCYFMISTGLCTTWALGFAGRGIKVGALFGGLLGLMGTGGMLMNFVFVPLPDQLRLPWAIGGILSGVIAGVIVSLVYRPKPASTTSAEG